MEDSQEAASEAEEAAVGSSLHINYLVTRFRSDSHVADTKFDSDDESSLLIKCRRAHMVQGKQSIFYIFPQILFIHKFLFIRDQYNIFPSFSSLI